MVCLTLKAKHTFFGMEIVFVGTGVSTAIPVMGHFGSCACHDAIHTPHSKNRRNNVSLLISKSKTKHEKLLEVASGRQGEPEADPVSVKRRDMTMGDPTIGSDTWNILIDCGKTFRAAYFEQLITRKVRSIDALLLTHEHADAIQGLDDLRDLQSFCEKGLHWVCNYYVPTFLTPFTLKTLDRQVGYIVRNSRTMGDAMGTAEEFLVACSAVESEMPSASRIIERRSTALDLWTVRDDAPQLFHVPNLCGDAGVVMYSVPVEHGVGYMSLGFVFGSGVRFHKNVWEGQILREGGGNGGACVAYISDVSHVPGSSLSFLKNLRKIDILVLDLLLGPGEKHFSHFCMDDFWDLVRTLQPRRVYGTGMYCVLEHKDTNASLSSQLQLEHASGHCLGVESVELAYDGLTLPIPL